MKKSVSNNTYLFPLPSVVVGTYDENDVPNMMTASWTGVVNSNKPMVSVSLRKATYSHDNIIQSGAFTISIPSKQYILEMDYVGTKSGKLENKFESTGLMATKSTLVHAPYVEDFPLVLECRLVKYDVLGLHTLFIGEILDVKVDEGCIKANGMPDMTKIDPIAYAHGERTYYEIGRYLGKANRLWQVTPLNKTMQTEDRKGVLALIHEFYTALDGSQPLEAFDEMIDWPNFKMVNGDLRVENREDFDAWYKDVTATVFNRKHIVEKLSMEVVDATHTKVCMDMYFRGVTWQPGDASSVDIDGSSRIEWTVVKNLETGGYLLQGYNIVML